MVSIKIVQAPQGDAPQDIREQWIGCILPQNNLVGATPLYQESLLDRKMVRSEAYSVNAQAALAILGEKCPSARGWFDTHLTSLNMPDKFTFDAPCAVEVWYPDASHPTLSEFVETFMSNCQTLSPEWIEHHELVRIAQFIGEKRWGKVLHEPLCKDLIEALVRTYIDAVRADLDMMTFDEVELITTYRENAHAFLKALAGEVVRYYPTMDKSSIMRPVTITEVMEQRGLITVDYVTGIVTPTQGGLDAFLGSLGSGLN